MPLTPDDRFILQSLSIEHLKLKLPDPLLHCEVYLTQEHFLSIECFNTENLEKVQAAIERLQYLAWVTTGALQIQVSFQDSREFQVETRMILEKDQLEALEFEQSIKCNLMVTTSVLEAPATSAPTSETASMTANQGRAITSLISVSVMAQQLSDLTGLSIAKTNQMIENSIAPRFAIGGEIYISEDVRILIFEDWSRKTVAAMKNGKLAEPMVETPPTEAAASSNGRSRRVSKTVPVAEEEAAAPTAKKATQKPQASASRTTRQASTGNKRTLNNLKISLSVYAATAKAALELLAPGNEEQQREIAKELAAETKASQVHMKKIIALYDARGRTDAGKIKTAMIREFSKLAAQPEASEAPSEAVAA